MQAINVGTRCVDANANTPQWSKGQKHRQVAQL